MIKRILSGCWFFFWGHLFSFFYDKKYLKGRWFEGRARGLCADGWKWVTINAMHRLFFRVNRETRFPIAFRNTVVFPENVFFDPNDLNNFQSTGIYIQAAAPVTIGTGTYIAPNVGIITSNHNINDLEKHDNPKAVSIGENCWIGMNSVILPGVKLGNHTIVGAGSIVTKSFEEGNCVIAGNPAKIIRKLTEDVAEKQIIE